jgi:hypothetical protein
LQQNISDRDFVVRTNPGPPTPRRTIKTAKLPLLCRCFPLFSEQQTETESSGVRKNLISPLA